ncbi:protein dalmatian isoform X2 [Scaptodrosophila lebanonensis]|uniref:Protein dalmatian isoform X2 n=1 Tax=Drosophila lebanonensis TaxID=7225 RepID=A0A6J2TG46_DROLE|nr:protein dalmatian isoform X2 [Scaptodrosophila lebanonensis]
MVKTRKKQLIKSSANYVSLNSAYRLRNKETVPTKIRRPDFDASNATLCKRKCVVLLKRSKLPVNKPMSTSFQTNDNALSSENFKNVARPREPSPVMESALDVSAFEPPRNSTMRYTSHSSPPKVCFQTKNNVNGPPAGIKQLSLKQTGVKSSNPPAGKLVSPCRVLMKRLSPKPSAPNASSQSKDTFKSPCQVRIKRLAAAIPKNTSDMKESTDEAVGPEKRHRFFHRDAAPARRQSSIKRNLYEYLSQSQTTDSDTEKRADPTADIIKKMVDEGRAVMVTRLKTTGRFRAKAIKKKIRPVGKRKQCSLQSLAEEVPAADNQAEAVQLDIAEKERPISPIYEPDENAMSDDDEPSESVQVTAQIHGRPQNPNQNVKTTTLNNLQRSVLLKQASKHTPDSLSKRRKLLEVARKFISTPVNRKNATGMNTSAISPIMPSSGGKRQTPASSGNVSPWRVSDEAPLPNTFVFGRNSSLLPSYSSDYIRRRNVYVPDEEPPPSALMEESVAPSLNDNSTANDSNGENIPPASPHRVMHKSPNARQKSFATPSTPTAVSGQENESSENFVHFPNPRRTLQHRSPLKDINILDVVVLPSWKKNAAVPPEKTPVKQTTKVAEQFSSRRKSESLFGFEDTLNDTENRPESASRQQQNQSLNLFGFEEFLNESEEQQITINPNTNKNITLHDKLQRIGCLRPKEQELPQVSKAPMRYAYDDPEFRAPKQRNIKDMLCSTMIATPLKTPANESANLFGDPEETFDTKKPRRTYVKEKPKRKRKQRVQLFPDTDSSEDDEQDSHESPQKQQAKKRACSRKDTEHMAKLEEFITSFNKECEEVEKFQLIIE